MLGPTVPWIASAVYRNVWPLLRPGGYQGLFRAMLRQREGLDRRSPQEVWQRQKQLLNEVLATAVEHVPYYRALAAGGRCPRSIDTPDDMQRVPVLTKEIIRREGKALLAGNFPAERIRANATGGSTGAPLAFWSDDDSVLRGNAGEAWALSLCGAKASASLAYLWGAGRFEKNFRKDFREGITRMLNNTIFIDCFRMSPQDLRNAHRKLSRFRPHCLIGYTSALVELAEFLRRERITPCYPRKAVISAAETLDDESRRTVESVFGVGMFNRYGSREIGPIAMQCSRREGLHIDCENVFVELADDPDGSGRQRILVTKLHQHSMPFLRYDIEDLADGPLEQCPCGLGYPVLKRVVGRVTEMIRTPDGKCLPGELFPHLFKDCGIASFQVAQEADYSVRVSLVKTPSQTPQQAQTLEDIVRRHLDGSIPLDIVYVDHIERTAAGKLLPVKSRAPRPAPNRSVV